MTTSPLANWHGPVKYCRAGRARSNGLANLVVLHTVEGEWTLDQAAAWMSNPRNTSMASAHYSVIADGSIGGFVAEEDTAYAAPPVNDYGIQIEIAGFARFTREEWMARSAQMDAVRLLVHDICFRAKIGTGFLDAAGVVNAVNQRTAGGITTHWEITKAYRVSTHTDPGQGFPLDYILLPPAKTIDLAQPALKNGDQGAEVTKLQGMVNYWFPPLSCGPVDGIFGDRTQAAVQGLQALLNARGYKTGAPDGVWNWLEFNACVAEFAKIGITGT